MKNDTPITLAVATYGNRAGAVSDFDRVMAREETGAFDHVAVAVTRRTRRRERGRLSRRPAPKHDVPRSGRGFVGPPANALGPSDAERPDECGRSSRALMAGKVQQTPRDARRAVPSGSSVAPAL